jgi:hypothetical protein
MTDNSNEISSVQNKSFDSISTAQQRKLIENNDIEDSLGELEEQEQEEKEEEWTTECLTEKLLLNLASTKETIINNNGRAIPVRKYICRARELMKWIPLTRPAPEFIINVNDLTPKIKNEIGSLSDSHRTLQYILTQAVGRIFENLDFEYYHISIAKNLRVKMMP